MRSLRRLLPILALLGACSVEAPQQYRVPDLRILAIRDWIGSTPTADADLGDTITLEALIANPQGRAPVTVEWYACAPVFAPPLPPCVDSAWLQRPDDFPSAPGVIPLGSTARVSTGLPELQALLQAASTAFLQAAVAEPSLQCSLYAEVPVVAIARAGEVVEVAVKRVRVTPTTAIASYPSLVGAYVVNLNPAVGAVQLAPTDVDACSGGSSLATACSGPAECGGSACAPDGFCAVPLTAGVTRTLCARGDTAWLQTYNQCGPDGSRLQLEEELEWQWYVSAGTIAQAGFDGNAVGNTVDLEPPSGPFTLWAIVRDGRGGTAWIVRDLDGAAATATGSPP